MPNAWDDHWLPPDLRLVAAAAGLLTVAAGVVCLWLGHEQTAFWLIFGPVFVGFALATLTA